MSYIRHLGIERKLLLILIAIVINGLVTEGPLLIVYILRLGARLEILGMIISTMVGFAIVASFFGGALGDIYGKKRMLQIALFLSFLGSISFAIISDWKQAMLLVALKGFATGLFVPMMNSLTAVLSHESKRGMGFGFTQTVRSATTIVGPITGGLLAEIYGFKVMWIGVALTTLVGLIILSLIKFEETASNVKYSNMTRILPDSFSKLSINLRNPIARTLLITTLLLSLAFATIESYVTVRASNIGASKSEIGLLGGVAGATFIFSYFGGITCDKLGNVKKKIYILTLIFAIRQLSILLLPFTMTVTQLIALWFIVNAYNSFSSPFWNAVNSGIIPRETLGTFFGAAFTMSAIGMILGPMLGGSIWSTSTEVTVYMVSVIIGLSGTVFYLLLLPPQLSKGVQRLEHSVV